jgi:molecular chaperone GrpE
LLDKKPEAEPEEKAAESKESGDLLVLEKRRGDELLTRLKYLQADFENYRKRVEKESKEAEETALRGLVSSLLSAVDELDLAVKNAADRGKEGGLVDGLVMVQKKLWSSLESVGLERIDCVGRTFDPSLHEAVEKTRAGNAVEATVVEEIRPGYVFRGRVVRPSMVKVELAAKRPDEQETELE